MVLHFCPNCANLLRYELASDGGRFACRTCSYVAYIQPGAKIKEKVILPRKKHEDIVVSLENALVEMRKEDTQKHYDVEQEEYWWDEDPSMKVEDEQVETDDWDEDSAVKVQDDETVKPGGCSDDKPEETDDPKATKPDQD